MINGAPVGFSQSIRRFLAGASRGTYCKTRMARGTVKSLGIFDGKWPRYGKTLGKWSTNGGLSTSDCYPLVISYITMAAHRNSMKYTHKRWWFSSSQTVSLPGRVPHRTVAMAIFLRFFFRFSLPRSGARCQGQWQFDDLPIGMVIVHIYMFCTCR